MAGIFVSLIRTGRRCAPIARWLFLFLSHGCLSSSWEEGGGCLLLLRRYDPGRNGRCCFWPPRYFSPFIPMRRWTMGINGSPAGTYWTYQGASTLIAIIFNLTPSTNFFFCILDLKIIGPRGDGRFLINSRWLRVRAIKSFWFCFQLIVLELLYAATVISAKATGNERLVIYQRGGGRWPGAF